MAYLVIFFNFVFGFCRNYMHHEGIMRTWNTIMLIILTQQQINAHTWATHLRKCFQQTTRLNGTVFDESPFILDVSRAATVCNVSNAAINIILEGKGPTRWGRNFDQKQKLGVKLPNPWDKNSIQSSPPRDKVFSLKLSTRARISSNLR